MRILYKIKLSEVLQGKNTVHPQKCTHKITTRLQLTSSIHTHRTERSKKEKKCNSRNETKQKSFVQLLTAELLIIAKGWKRLKNFPEER